MLAGDRERLAEPARAGAEETLVVQTSPPAHLVEPMGRLERPDEDRVGDALWLADEVDAPVDPVRAVDVRVAGRAEHRGVTLGQAAVAVCGRVLVLVGLELDDLPADAVDEQGRADQLFCDFVHGPGEESASNHGLAAFAS